MKKNKQIRPSSYQYFKILSDHLGGDLSKVFNGKLVYPRQVELHLPSNHKYACNFNCCHCQGMLLNKSLAPFELDALEIIDKLQGKIPYFIYGGAYSEPTLNPYMMTFLNMTKKHHSYFGIHTNGSMLLNLEKTQGWLTELCRIATDKQDYLSVSLDAGRAASHTRSKNLNRNYFDDIIEGIRMAVKIRGKRNYPAIRVCYLLNDFNSSTKEIRGIIAIMKKIKVDSLRFSIPYDVYGKDFSKVRAYKKNVEIQKNNKFEKILKPLMSKSHREKPYIFYLPPSYQDVEKMNFKQCIYGYYQITIGADGYVYKCSSTATPTFKMVRLGKLTNDLKKFEKMILANADPGFNASTCFKVGARCNRMALEINNKWRDLNEKN
jgi:MoaA/NifB/PqqE/SkfB family radical SAM enzyme